LDKVKLTIDGTVIEAERGSSVLEAALDAGIYIPHLCWHRDLSPFGACRLCVVEIDGVEGAKTSCTTQVEEGMKVTTKSPKLDAMRRLAMELMLTAHPEDCSTCPKYLNCELQSLSQYLGANPARLRRRANIHPVNTSNPLFVHDFTRCVLCERCVRACHEMRGVGVLSAVKDEKGRVRISTPMDKLLMDTNCRFCGACAEVCPTGALRDKEGLIKKERGRENSLVPCRAACPAGINIPRYVRYVKEKNYPAAVAVIREKVPFPHVLGHICNHKCELDCRRKELNEAVAIRELKRTAAQNDDGSWKKNSKKLPETGKKVAVIGSGPAGLTAAYYLVKKGHSVTVFEELPVAGGMMSVGIPEYRLPRDVVAEEIAEIEKAGVEIRLNTKVKSVDELFGQGYDAVLVAVGTHQGVRLPLEGADLEGVLINTDFLRAASLGNPMKVGDKVVVLGGGNVAFDCAGVARRLGAKEIHVACLEACDCMTASEEEIKEAAEDGVQIHNSQNFRRIVGENGRVKGVECENVKSFSFGEDGRLNVEVEPDSVHVYEADTVIFATGQRPALNAEFGIELGRGNRAVVKEGSAATNREGVFAVGDAVTGTAFVINAIQAGRCAASEIDVYLGGDGDISETLAPEDEPNPCIGVIDGFGRMERKSTDRLSVEERTGNFSLVDKGFSEENACGEAVRCLQCDLRIKISPPVFWGNMNVQNTEERR